jgi:hypothetical protein
LGTLHDGQQALKLATANYLEPIYEAKTPVNIQPTVTVSRLYPHVISEEDSIASQPMYPAENFDCSQVFLKGQKPWSIWVDG